MRHATVALALALALVAASGITSAAAQGTRRQVTTPGSAALQPGEGVTFVPAEALVGRNVTVENHAEVLAAVSLTGEGVLSVAVPVGFAVQLGEFVEATPACQAVDGPNVQRCSGVFAPAGQFVTITARALPAPARPPSPVEMEPVALLLGCTNETLTFPAGTSLDTVAANISPASALQSIFRFDAAQSRFLGYSPAAPAPVSDYTSVTSSLEPVFICMSSAGMLMRPRVSSVDQSGTLVAYTRSGGLAGFMDELTIGTSGAAVLRRHGAASRFTLDQQALDQLRAALDGANIPVLASTLPPPRAVPDAFTYTVTYQGATVTVADPAIPAALRPVLDLLNTIIARHS